jgi:glycosyltransferase involved in cell wall biosynthesis
MCRAFADEGLDIELAAPSSGKSPSEMRSVAEEITGRGVGFEISLYEKKSIAGRFAMIGAFWGARRIIQSRDADFCWLRNALAVPVAMKAGMQVIYEAHNSILHANRVLNAIRTRRLTRSATDTKFSLFIAISENLAEFWRQRGVPPQKLLAAHDGVDAEAFREVPDMTSLRRELGLNPDSKIVTYAGSLYADREITSIISLAKSFPDAQFVVVGGPGDLAETHAAHARRNGLGNIGFTGRVAHQRVKDYLFAADVLLMVWSRQVKTIDYCSPLKVFEYMAAGRTLVGHGFPTIREVLTDGKDALLADPNSFAELKHKLAMALDMEVPNPLSVAAREAAFERHSWKARARRILACLN